MTTIVNNIPSLINTIMTPRIPLLYVIGGILGLGGGLLANKWNKPKNIPILELSSSPAQSFSGEEWLNIHPEFVPQKDNIKIAPTLSWLLEGDTKINEIDITDSIKLLEIKNDNIIDSDNKEKKHYIILEKNNFNKNTIKYNLSVTQCPIIYFIDYTPIRRQSPDNNPNRESFYVKLEEESYHITVTENSSLQEKAKSIQNAFTAGRTCNRLSGDFQEFSFFHTPEGYVSTFTKPLLYPILHPIVATQAITSKASEKFNLTKDKAVVVAQTIGATVQNIASFVPILHPIATTQAITSKASEKFNLTKDKAVVVAQTIGATVQNIASFVPILHPIATTQAITSKASEKFNLTKNKAVVVAQTIGATVQNIASFVPILHPIATTQAIATTAYNIASPALATAQAVTETLKNIPSSIADYYTSSTEHSLTKDNLILVEKNNHFMIKNKESNTQSDIHLRDAKDIGGHYKDVTFTLDNKDYRCKLYTKRLNVEDLKNIVNQAIEHFIKGKSSSDSDTSPHILPEARDDTYPIPTQYDMKYGKDISRKLIKDGHHYSLFSPTDTHLGDIHIDTTEKNDRFAKNNLGKYNHIHFINNKVLTGSDYHITLYKDTVDTPDIISALEQALEAKEDIFLNKDLKPFKTHIDWKNKYPPHKRIGQANEAKILYDKNTITQTISLTPFTDLVEINNKGQKSFLTIHKRDATRPSDILSPISLEEKNTLIGGKEFILHSRYDGILHTKTLPPHIKSLQDIDINDPETKKLFTPDIIPLTTTSSPLNRVYRLLKDKDDYSILNTEHNNRTPVTLSTKQKDIKGDYIHIDFNINTRRYTQKLYGKNPPTEKDIQDALNETLKHLEDNPTTTSYALDDKRDPAYPPVTSQIFEADSNKMQLVKDGNIYNLFSEDGKTCLTKDDFKADNTTDPFAEYRLGGTHHSLNFTFKNKPYKIDIYKDTVSDDNVLEAVKKAIDSKSDIILDTHLNEFKKAKYWKDTYPILAGSSVPTEIKRLLDKDTLTRTSELTPTTSLIELNHKGEKSFLTSQKQPSGEEKFTSVQEWQKEDKPKTKMLSFEIDHQKYDSPLPIEFKSLQEIDITLPTLKDIFKPTTDISTQELISTHPKVKQKSPEPDFTYFTPSSVPYSSSSYRPKKPTGKRKASKQFIKNSAHKTYSFSSSIMSGLWGFLGNMFGKFLNTLGDMTQYAPNTQSGFMIPQQQPIPNYFMPPPSYNNMTLPEDLLMPQQFNMDMLQQHTPWTLPENLSPNIDVYKPPYDRHTPVYRTLPQKGGKFPYAKGQSGGKIPKAEPFFKPNKYNPNKKDPTQKQYDPFKYQQDQTFYPNYAPSNYQNTQTVKPPYPMSPQDMAYMEQLLDDPNKP